MFVWRYGNHSHRNPRTFKAPERLECFEKLPVSADRAAPTGRTWYRLSAGEAGPIIHAKRKHSLLSRSRAPHTARWDWAHAAIVSELVCGANKLRAVRVEPAHVKQHIPSVDLLSVLADYCVRGRWDMLHQVQVESISAPSGVCARRCAP